MVYIIKPRRDVYCFKLNFNISNVGYCDLFARRFSALGGGYMYLLRVLIG